MNRRELKTHKTLLAQRDEARAAAAKAQAEVASLRGKVGKLADERVASQVTELTLRASQQELEVAQRLQRLDGAEQLLTQERDRIAGEAAREVERQAEDCRQQVAQMQRERDEAIAQTKEARVLRRRLEAKSAQIRELQTEVNRLKGALAAKPKWAHPDALSRELAKRIDELQEKLCFAQDPVLR